MTDEEMAEEYAKAHIVQYPKRVIISENGFCTSEDEVKQAFLAGLKAGRPQWHKVADGDLPPENTGVLIYCYGKVRQAFFKGFFKSLYGDCRVEEVIAWCEIPTFDKE